jgi:hypothetical protein
VADGPDASLIEAALRCERRFVLTLGGFAVEIPGATLVTHERVPVPRFNYVEVREVGRDRQAAFFERALDHYFQRALRPIVRVPTPVPEHLVEGLTRFGFRARDRSLQLLVAPPAKTPASDGPATASAGSVRVAHSSEIEGVAAFWTGERERTEFRAALETAWAHPHPNEQLVPILAAEDGRIVATALVYRERSHAGLFGVATQVGERGHGAATELVATTLRSDPAGRPAAYSLWVDTSQVLPRLAALGFRRVAEFVEFELPPGAELSLPPPGPPGPPRWRPPRNGGASGTTGTGQAR